MMMNGTWLSNWQADFCRYLNKLLEECKSRLRKKRAEWGRVISAHIAPPPGFDEEPGAQEERIRFRSCFGPLRWGTHSSHNLLMMTSTSWMPHGHTFRCPKRLPPHLASSRSDRISRIMQISNYTPLPIVDCHPKGMLLIKLQRHRSKDKLPPSITHAVVLLQIAVAAAAVGLKSP